MAKQRKNKNHHALDAAENASGDYVRHAYGELLYPRNKYSPLVRDINPRTHASDRKRIAATQISHLVSGWGYASSAITAYLKNSKEEAVHYAYYAELKAALSLYAGSGVYFQQGENFYIQENGKVKILTNDPKFMRTHKIAWDFWGEWVNRGDVLSLILDGFRLAPSVSLRDLQPVLSLFDARGEVKDWGKDLMQGPFSDHRARNEATYKPGLVRQGLSSLSVDNIEFIAVLCKLLLPAENGLQDSVHFDTAFIQYQLVRTIKDRVDRAGGSGAQEQRDRLIAEICDLTGQPEQSIGYLIPERMDPGISDVFEKAAESASSAENILARGIFLLRLGTVSVRNNIVATNSEAAKQWLLNWLDVSGFIDSESGIDPFDLCSDFESVLELFIREVLPDFRLDVWGADSQAYSKIARVDSSLAWSVFS